MVPTVATLPSVEMRLQFCMSERPRSSMLMMMSEEMQMELPQISMPKRCQKLRVAFRPPFRQQRGCAGSIPVKPQTRPEVASSVRRMAGLRQYIASGVRASSMMSTMSKRPLCTDGEA
ncbi:hypothetical protein FGO68_gene6740 [Halteria grandinella]|uniref:Uncharacterized protein n=1 Tax=Halteria grandinella TaxID=5974 RepID=A0A8J8T432_HALGN|nr:hypothetical protein FGO68_gene6740 [Halteria grandinella]